MPRLEVLERQDIDPTELDQLYKMVEKALTEKGFLHVEIRRIKRGS